MTKIDGEYLVTDDPSVAVIVFGNLSVEYRTRGLLKYVLLHRIEMWELVMSGLLRWNPEHDGKFEIRIPRALVREAIRGTGHTTRFGWGPEDPDDEDPIYWVDIATEDSDISEYQTTAVNDITKGKTVGELRKLVEWANERA